MEKCTEMKKKKEEEAEEEEKEERRGRGGERKKGETEEKNDRKRERQGRNLVIGQLLHVRHCSKCFMYINTVYPLNNPMRWLYYSLYS